MTKLPDIALDGFTAPNRGPGGPGTELGYDDVRVFAVRGRVSELEVYGKGARTAGGVAIGDPLSRVKRVYRGVTCFPLRNQAEFLRSARCELKTAPHVFLYFGDDPIKVINLATGPFHD
jgi:hypothetical protein